MPHTTDPDLARSPRPSHPAHRALAIAASALLFGLASCTALGHSPAAPAQVVRGPLRARVQHPLALTSLSLAPRRAVTQPAGSFGAAPALAYSSIHEVDNSLGDRVDFDGEFLHASLLMRYGLTDRTDIEVQPSGLYSTSGFLDNFIEEFHGLVGLANGGRENSEQNDFGMEVRHEGRTIYELEEDEFQAGDLPVIVTHRLRGEDDDGPALAARGAVEFPTGDEEGGTSNGELDYGLGLLFEESSGRWTWSASGGWIWRGQPDRFREEDVRMRDGVELQVGSEYRWSAGTSLLLQLVWLGPLVRDVELEEINREVLDLGMGVAWDLGEGSRFSASFHEDLVAATGPDFTVFLGLTFGL